MNGQSIFFGNSFNSAKSPPKSVDFPHDYVVKICFYSGLVVVGHKGFNAEITERKNNNYVTSPNYPEDINDETYLAQLSITALCGHQLKAGLLRWSGISLM